MKNFNLNRKFLWVLMFPILLISSLQLSAQRNCGTVGHMHAEEQANPDVLHNRALIEAHTQAYINNTDENSRVAGIITIPVVVHVVYKNGTENISDAQIQSQIDVLNEDFRRLNTDADATWSQAADTEIEFCMSTVDPNGNPTNGITRTSTVETSFDFSSANEVKFASSGGKDAWPADDYLNMWICDITGNWLGYAQFPGGADATDGVVMDYLYFGTIGTATAPFNLGRTATHEVGHWLNLKHIWGDGNCSVDDLVTDTPASDLENYGCATTHVSCSTTDMVQNYMDYSDDACMNLFTQGQKTRMRALFDPSGSKASLLNSIACGGPSNNACSAAIVVTNGALETGSTVLATNIEELTACSAGGGGGLCSTGGSGAINFGTGVWFKYTASAGESIVVSTANVGTNFDTEIQVFEGTCGALVCVGGDDDGGDGTGNGNDSEFCWLSTGAVDYFIYVDGNLASTGNYAFSLNVLPPANDACAGAIVVTDGALEMGSTVLATNVEALPACSTGGGGGLCSTGGTGTINFGTGVWFKYTASAGESIVVSTANVGTNFDTEIQVFEGTCGALVCVGGDDDGGDGTGNGNDSEFCWLSTGAVDYYIYVDGHSSITGNYAFSLNVLLPSPPANDACAGAIVVTDDALETGSTVFATNVEALSACAGGGGGGFCATGGDNELNNFQAGVWFKYTAAAAGESIVVSTANVGTDFDTQLKIFEGTCGALVCVGGDDQGGTGNASEFCWLSTGAVDYYIYLDGYANNTGNYTFSLNVLLPPPPPNDACAGAIVVADGALETGSTVFATNVEALSACAGGGGGGFCATGGDNELNNFQTGVWFKYTAAAAGESIVVSTTNVGTDFDTQLKVFEGTCGALVCVGGDDQGGTGNASEFCWLSTGAVDYYIYLDGYDGDLGNFAFSLNVLTTCSSSSQLFVDQSATGANNGSSWTDAFTDLQDALAVVDPNDCSIDILMAQGTYKPGTTRNSFFTIDKDTKIFGAYSAGGSATADPELYPTILSGDVDNDGSLAGNSYHVIRATGGSNISLTDLTIEGGNADGNILTQFGRSRGGGLYINDANCTVDNCNITNNAAGLGGGVFATLSTEMIIDNSNVTMNTADRGSALYHSNETNMFVTNSSITDNTANVRCAVEINNSLSTVIENSVIANNIAANANAIALIATNRNQTFQLLNTTVLGGPTNRSLFSMQVGFGDTLDVDVVNSIIAQLNVFGQPGKNIVVFNNNQLNFNATNSYFSGTAFTNLQGLGTNNIVETSTLFAEAAGDLLLNPDFSVQACSPVVDSGNNTLATNSLYDIAGNDRTFNGTIDMGAYESQANCNPTREQEDNTEVINNDIAVYPNPTKGIVNIKADLENITIQINDILGKTVLNSSNQRVINISHLPPGTYFLTVLQDGEWKGTEKLVKN